MLNTICCSKLNICGLDVTSPLLITQVLAKKNYTDHVPAVAIRVVSALINSLPMPLPSICLLSSGSIRKILTGAEVGLVLKPDIDVMAKIKRKSPVERGIIAANIGEHVVGGICESVIIADLERDRC